MMNNERGSIIVTTVLVLAVIVSTMVLLQSGMYAEPAISRRTILYRGAARAYLSSVQSALENPDAIRRTLKAAQNNTAGNPLLESCLRDPTYDCPPGAHPMTVIAPDGSILVDPNSATSGFSVTATTCNTLGSDGCHLRLILNWTPTCPTTGPCNLPTITLSGTLSASASNSALRSALAVAVADLAFTSRFTP